ncbi:hypothetical protein D8O05_10895 [Burkholderia mallei]|nr:hypothetical protein D8O03_11835 [Burkholderia mallei]RKO05485.1 hypothetical protein D8O05_10895 [Burkholderia mallei]
MRHRLRIRLAGARPTRSTRSTRPGAIGRRAARTRQQSTVNSQQSTVNNRFSILRTFGSRNAGPHLTCIRKFAACVCKAVPMRRMRAAFSGGASDENG